MNRENLQTLATFLAYDPRGVDFQMDRFTSGWYSPDLEDDMTECGTAGCAVGHAAFIFPKFIGERWDKFSERVFGLDIEADWRLWDWRVADKYVRLYQNTEVRRASNTLIADLLAKIEREKSTRGLPAKADTVAANCPVTEAAK